MSLNDFYFAHRPLIMGILNVTPDSFSDGGQFSSIEHAKIQAEKMVEEGVDIIDIGGESTRPNAAPVTDQQELDRVLPVIEEITKFGIPISIDTSKSTVMREAVKAGAAMINDVRALQNEGAAEAAAQLKVPVCIMHMQGLPETMQESPNYQNVIAEVKQFLKQRIDALVQCGIEKELISIDPGFGFGKTVTHNFQLLKHLAEFKSLGAPILAGLSRKSMLGAVTDKPVEQRLYSSIAAATIAADNGAQILRVHDVGPTLDAIKIWLATKNA